MQLGAAGFVLGGTEALLLRPSALPHRHALAIYEAKDVAGRLFAQRMLDWGVAVSAVEDDVSVIWRSRVQTALGQGLLPVIGLTSLDILFCLERLSWTVGRRLECSVSQLPQHSHCSWEGMAAENWIRAALADLHAADSSIGVAHVSQFASSQPNRVLWVIHPATGFA